MFSSAEELIKKYLAFWNTIYIWQSTFPRSTQKCFLRASITLNQTQTACCFGVGVFFSHLEVLWVWKILLWNTSEKNERVRKKVQKVQKGIKSISDPNQQHLNWKEYAFTFFPTFYTSLIGHHAVYKLTRKVNI